MPHSTRHARPALPLKAQRSGQFAASLGRPAELTRGAVALFVAICLVALPARPTFAADTAAAALTVSKRALQAYRAKRYKQAALLYRAAYQTHPTELRYLYNAARAAQLAGQLEDAQRGFVSYLLKANGDGHVVPKARQHLEEVRAALRTREDQRRKGQQRAKSPSPSPAAGPQRVAGWVLLAGGVIAGGVGGAVLVNAWNDQSDLDAKLAIRDADNKIVGISKSAADIEVARINKQLVLGWAVTGVGLVGLGVGALLLATAPTRNKTRAALSAPPSRVSLMPWRSGRGLTLGLRF